MITAAQIENLSTRPGVKTVAVQNFLCTLGDMTAREAYHNMQADARSYRWNDATVEAIEEGLELNYPVCT